MSITEKLRKWASDSVVHSESLAAFPPMHTVHGTLETLLAIADNIDAEHENEIHDLKREHSEWVNSRDTDWVELPKDADGVPIRLGDKITVPWRKHKVYEVAGFSYDTQLGSGERRIWVDVYSSERMGLVPLCSASSCHHHAPTVEGVLREFICDHEEGVRDEVDLIAEYAAKLRLAGDAE